MLESRDAEVRGGDGTLGSRNSAFREYYVIKSTCRYWSWRVCPGHRLDLLGVLVLALGFVGCARRSELPIGHGMPRPGWSGTAELRIPLKGPLAAWFQGGIAGKRIVYWGNSTVSNAYQVFIDLGEQTKSGGELSGLEYRWDMAGVQSDGDGNVTITLQSPVSYKVGQWVSFRFSEAQNADVFWKPSVQITAVDGNSFTYRLPVPARLASGAIPGKSQVASSILVTMELLWPRCLRMRSIQHRSFAR